MTAGQGQIFLVEDDQTIRLATEYALVQAGYEVTSAADGNVAFDMLKSATPDLILLDIMLPGMSGLTIVEKLRARGNETPVLLISALGSEKDTIKGFEAGADDYMAKPFSLDELLARVRARMRRTRRGHESEVQGAEYGDLRIDLERSIVFVNGERADLRNKEYDLLVALASRAGLLCTRQWLAQEVWGEEFVSTSRTIDTHIRRVRSVIERGKWRYIHTVHGAGYRFEAIDTENSPLPGEHDDSAGHEAGENRF